MKVATHPEKCVGSGLCVQLAPEVFDQRDEDGIVVLLDETPASAHHGLVRGAAAICPAMAIDLTSDAAAG